MRRWCIAAGFAGLLGVVSCAAGVDETLQTGSPSPAESACLGEGQTALPRVDADQRDLDAPPAPRRIRPMIYPQTAIDARADGTVLVRVLVCADGKILDTRIVHGAPLLDDAAVETARVQAYVPATRGGRRVAAWFDVFVEFTLP